MIRILAISGSLRVASTHSALLRAAVDQAPEGVAIENALDWMVGWGELAGMPVALFHALHYGGQRAHENLTEILPTMSLRTFPKRA